ncbi:MAG: MBL fold metallo-hydrolase [Melioribacteraceae bacterium]|nr:MBL fold metallo-hydrolase [Melioribacteraceae bacterium]
MKLSVLVDNNRNGKFNSEHGLSYLIECDNQKILFDTGQSPLFLKNASLLGYDLSTDIETIVLSHGHYDHGNGLEFIRNKNLIVHPEAFIKRQRKKDNSEIGLSLTKEEIESRFNLITTRASYNITENLIFLGEIPRLNNFESQTTDFRKTNGEDDFIIDDSALVYKKDDEIIVISGCAHSGICNIIEYAKKITGIEKIKTVIGGFHLKYYDELTKQTIQYLKNEIIEKLYPAHCTSFDAVQVLSEEFRTDKVKAGITLEF